MLKSSIRVDLPSVETNRRPGPIEWVRSLFGAELDLRSGKEELTVGAFSLIEGLVAGFARAGVMDVISFLVDKKVVYLDTNEVPDDLPLIARAAEAAGVLDQRFREMHLVLAHQDEALHTIIDCKVTSQVMLGQSELEIQLSSRLSELQIRQGETAEQYAERIKAFALVDASFEPARRRLEQLTERIAAALGPALVGSKVACEDALVQLIRPDRGQISRFGKLAFGDEVQSPEYRPVPTLQRAGAYADPFYYYYHDPYYDYMNYVLVDAMIHNVMMQSAMSQSHYVQVVDPAGTMLFSGDQAALHANDSWIGNDAVSYDSGGQLMLSDAVSWSDDDRNQSWASFASSSSTCSSSSSLDSSSCSSASSCSSGSACGSSCNSGSSCGSSCSSGSD
jgi:hypothetical protein